MAEEAGELTGDDYQEMITRLDEEVDDGASDPQTRDNENIDAINSAVK